MDLWFHDEISKPEIQAVLLTAFLALVGFVMTRLLQPRILIRWGLSYIHFFIVPQETGNVNIRIKQFWFRNFGRSAGEDVQIVLNYPPLHFDIFPKIKYTTQLSDDGRLFIHLDRLSDREEIFLSILNTDAELPEIINVRVKDGRPKNIQTMVTRRFPNFINYIIVAFMIFGLVSAVYFLVSFIIRAVR